MKETYKTFFKKYNDFNNESSVEEFLKVMLIHFMIYTSLFIILIIGVAIRQSNGPQLLDSVLVIGSFIIAASYFLLTIFPTISLSVRRLKNAGFSWPYILMFLVPFIGTTVLTVLLILPSKKEKSEWGYSWRE